ncbi:hypothetical protein [uncultured Phocaeicola sp.]|jgi:uncharacterized protein YwqG|uniref:hypothetical protein n=1 Tax=uncultured Phocaeicola sp. TaxID=990718 RepID=UPI002626F0B2|nr:hypothetical protein [uncultured Phocaeicola sp.]
MGKFNGFSGDYNSQPDNISVSNLNFILTGSEKRAQRRANERKLEIQQQEFQKCTSRGDLQKYLRDNADNIDNPYVKIAEDKLDDMDFEKAKGSHDKLTEYRKKHPKGKHYDEAGILISQMVKQTSTRSYNGPGFSQIIAYILWGISAFVGISVFVTMISKNSTIFASAGAAIGAAAPGLLLGNRIYNS